MNNVLVYKIASFILSKLDEKERCIKTCDLNHWVVIEFSKQMKESDSRALSFYYSSALSLLDEELGLIRKTPDNLVTITEKGRDVSKNYTSIDQFITRQKIKDIWNKRLDFLNKTIPIASAICGAISTFIGLIMQINLLFLGGTFFAGIALGLCLHKFLKF